MKGFLWLLLFSLLCSVVPGLRTPDSDQPLPSSNAPPCLPWVWPSNVPTGVTRQDLPAALNTHRPAAWLQQNAEQIQTNQLSKLTTNILNICISHIYIPPGVWFLFLYSYIVTVQLFYLQQIGLENEEIWVTWKRAWIFFVWPDKENIMWHNQRASFSPWLYPVSSIAESLYHKFLNLLQLQVLAIWFDHPGLALPVLLSSVFGRIWRFFG